MTVLQENTEDLLKLFRINETNLQIFSIHI